MAFNLKKVLKAMLFSTSQPLSIKDIQASFTRFHEQGMFAGVPADTSGAEGDEGAPPPAGASPEAIAALSAGPSPTSEEPAEIITENVPFDSELYQDVPSLVTSSQIREVMNEISLELQAADEVFQLVEGSTGFRLTTHPRFARWIRILRDEPPPVRLSQSALETLAVIAYRQPVTRAEIEHIRGVSADAGITKLLERELIYIVGRSDLPGRPLQYGTTEQFFEFVGVKSLDELPASDVLSHRQVDEWLQNAMNPKSPSDGDMGLEEEGAEQMSLDDAARAVAVEESNAASAEAVPEVSPVESEKPQDPAN